MFKTSTIRHFTLLGLCFLLCGTLSAQKVKPANGYILQSIPLNDKLDLFETYQKMDEKGWLWIVAFNGIGRFDGKNLEVFKDSFCSHIFGGFQKKRGDIETWSGQFYISTSHTIWEYTGMAAHPFKITTVLDTSYVIRSFKPYNNNETIITFENKPGIWLLKNRKLLLIAGQKTSGLVLYRGKGGLLFAAADSVKDYFVLRDGKLLNHVQTHQVLHAIDNAAEEDDRWAWANKRLYKLGASGITDSLPFYDYKKIKVGTVLTKDRNSNIFYCFAEQPRNSLYQLMRWQNNAWEKIADVSNDLISGSPINEDAAGNISIIFWGNIYRLSKSPYTKVAGNFNLLHFGRSTPRNSIVIGIDTYLPGPVQKAGVQKQWWSANGDKWYATNNGLYVKHKNNNYVYYPGLADYPLCEDEDGTVWFRNIIKGYISYYKAGHFFHFPDKEGYIKGDVINLYVSKNLLFHSGNSSFTHIYDIKNQKLLASYSDKGNKGTFYPDSNGKVLTIFEGSSVDMIECDSIGIKATDINLPQRKDGSAANNYVFINFDHSNNLWASSLHNNGKIDIFIRDREGNFSKAPIAVPSPFEDDIAQIIYGLNGKMYFVHYTITDRDDVYCVDTDSVISTLGKSGTAILGPYLTNINIFNKPQYWPDLGIATDSFGLPINPSFSSQQNMLSFRFNAISPSLPESVNYQYKLQGFEKDWQTAKENEITYTNLAPGNYTFFVRAADVRQQWTAPLAYTFSIRPPWYKTWWAYTLWVVLASSAAGILFTLRLRALKRKEHADKLIVEQQLKALRAQINPHFLQNTFEFLSQSLNEQPVKYTQKMITQLSSYLRNVLNLSDETLITLEDEIMFSNEYLAINQLLFNNSFTYNIAVGDEVDTFGVQLPSMLLQPLLENAIKHGVRFTGNQNALIDVRIYADEAFTYCAIGNTNASKTIPAKNGHRPKGLDITEQRLSLLFGHTKHRHLIMANDTQKSYEVIVKIPR